MATDTAAPLCACGCGQPVIRNHGKWNRYLFHHQARVQPTGASAYRWKGGVIKSIQGYALVHVPDHPRASHTGYVRRAILIAEQTIGRPLRRGEVVHHRNRQRDDDRPENLEVLASQSVHLAHHNRSIHRPRVLTEPQVIEIKRLQSLRGTARTGPYTDLQIAKRFGVGVGSIRAIRLRITFAWVMPSALPHSPE